MQEQMHLGSTDKKLVVLCDNSTIHKAKQVISCLESSQILMVTIPPYSLTLNAAEKIKMYEDKGR